MMYKEQVKESKRVLRLIEDLEDKEVLEFSYGKGFRGEPNVYTLKCYIDAIGDVSYSVWTNYSGMNVGSLSKTRVNCYSYDMMSQRTQYSFKLWEMEVGVSVTNIDKQ
tara:strand:+ start:858 stop:1181 length:324 start_codon:yes stop_codon:yes gene_type:complete